MPYKSEEQRRYFNSPAGKAKIGKEEVEHWNEVSKGKELPEKADDNKSGFNAAMHSYNNEVAKGNLDKAKSLLEAATKEFENYEDKSTKKAAKIELNNKRRTNGMKAIDKAIRICDESYTVSVKEASDRDASRVIGIAQRIGFITKDKGYTIDLIGGDASMFNKFKREIAGIKGVKII